MTIERCYQKSTYVLQYRLLKISSHIYAFCAWLRPRVLMVESIHVDCSAPPGHYEPDNDISGAGVSRVTPQGVVLFILTFLDCH